MQPYFFPYLGHFALIARCDEWVVFDITQYTPKTWMNRNQVLHPNGGPNWVSVPLANGSIAIRTADARVLDVAAARDSVLGKLSHYRRKAPHCAAVEAIVRDTFNLPAGDTSLVHLNVRGLDAVCRHLGLPFKRRIASELALGLPPELGPGDWALEICSRLGADAYLNPVGGSALFDPQRFAERGVELAFLHVAPYLYSAAGFAPLAGLSILDVLMWNDSAEVRSALRAAEIVEPLAA
ncbi:MAG: WbqC family protein [Bacteriovorax sp.]|nr:WbqC family protein [Rhizobacter sp.]